MHSHNQTLGWISMAAFVALIIAFAAITSILQKKRTAALAALAPIMGFDFEGEGWTHSARAQMQTALFDRGHSKKFRNVMTGMAAKFPASIFDYHYTVGGGKNSQTWVQTVVAFTVDLCLPVFELRPETFIDRIGDTFTHKDIDFESNPEFSHRYLLRGPEPDNIRLLFSPALLSFLESLPSDKRWHIEADTHTLLLYRLGVTVAPEQIQSLLQETLSLAQNFLGCCGLKART